MVSLNSSGVMPARFYSEIIIDARRLHRLFLCTSLSPSTWRDGEEVGEVVCLPSFPYLLLTRLLVYILP